MNRLSDNVLSWLVTAFASWYVAWTAYSLSHRVPVIAQLFSAMGAQLPLPTRVVIAVCTPAILWPIGGGTVLFLIVKEVRCERIRTKVVISTIVFMATACVSAVITEVIFQPMLSLIEKVG